MITVKLTKCFQRVNHFPRSYELTRKDRWTSGCFQNSLNMCGNVYYGILNIGTFAGCTRTLSGCRSRRVQNTSISSQKPSWFPTSTPSSLLLITGWEVSWLSLIHQVFPIHRSPSGRWTMQWLCWREDSTNSLGGRRQISYIFVSNLPNYIYLWAICAGGDLAEGGSSGIVPLPPVCLTNGQCSSW